MVEDKVIREVFDFLKIELNGIVCAPFLNYLERKYKKQKKENANDR